MGESREHATLKVSALKSAKALGWSGATELALGDGDPRAEARNDCVVRGDVSYTLAGERRSRPMTVAFEIQVAAQGDRATFLRTCRRVADWQESDEGRLHARTAPFSDADLARYGFDRAGLLAELAEQGVRPRWGWDSLDAESAREELWSRFRVVWIVPDRDPERTPQGLLRNPDRRIPVIALTDLDRSLPNWTSVRKLTEGGAEREAYLRSASASVSRLVSGFIEGRLRFAPEATKTVTFKVCPLLARSDGHGARGRPVAPPKRHVPDGFHKRSYSGVSVAPHLALGGFLLVPDDPRAGAKWVNAGGLKDGDARLPALRQALRSAVAEVGRSLPEAAAGDAGRLDACPDGIVRRLVPTGSGLRAADGELCLAHDDPVAADEAWFRRNGHACGFAVLASETAVPSAWRLDGDTLGHPGVELGGGTEDFLRCVNAASELQSGWACPTRIGEGGFERETPYAVEVKRRRRLDAVEDGYGAGRPLLAYGRAADTSASKAAISIASIAVDPSTSTAVVSTASKAQATRMWALGLGSMTGVAAVPVPSATPAAKRASGLRL